VGLMPVDAAKRRESIEFLRVPADDVVNIQWVDNGAGWVAVLLKSAEAVLALAPFSGETAVSTLTGRRASR